MTITYKNLLSFYAMTDSQGEHVSFVDVKPAPGAMVFGNNTTGYTSYFKK
jgi:hypothetical protein